MKYIVVIEATATSFSAYSPDLPGCVATGTARDETERNMKDAVEFHIEEIKLEGLDIPPPSSSSAYLNAAS